MKEYNKIELELIKFDLNVLTEDPMDVSWTDQNDFNQGEEYVFGEDDG